MSDEMDGVIGELGQKLVQVEDVIRKVIVSTRSNPLGLSVATPIERNNAVSCAHQLSRDGVEAPSDVEKSVGEDDIDRTAAPSDDVVS
jgi:hypothetical protein